MADPLRRLNTYLQTVQRPSNLVPLLAFTSEQWGPKHQAVHQGTYTFRGVVVGQGQGSSKAMAKRAAAIQALQHFSTHGIPEEYSDPVHDLNTYLYEIQGPKNLVPLLHFTSVQTGPSRQTVHTGTYTFRGVVVGTGQSKIIGVAQRAAAMEALQYFYTHGIPGGNIEPYLTPMEIFFRL